MVESTSRSTMTAAGIEAEAAAMEYNSWTSASEAADCLTTATATPTPPNTVNSQPRAPAHLLHLCGRRLQVARNALQPPQQQPRHAKGRRERDGGRQEGEGPAGHERGAVLAAGGLRERDQQADGGGGEGEEPEREAHLRAGGTETWVCVWKPACFRLFEPSKAAGCRNCTSSDVLHSSTLCHAAKTAHPE